MIRILLTFVGIFSLVSFSFAAVNITVKDISVSIQNDLLALHFDQHARIWHLLVNGTNIINTDGEKSFYLDWNKGGEQSFSPKSVHVVEQTSSRVHFYWLQENYTKAFDIELHYIMEDGFPGVYSYAKYMNNKDVNVSLGETRMVYRYNNDIVTQGTNQQRFGTIPNATDYKNATQVQDATHRFANGTYYTKYDYAAYIRETHYQGMYGNGYGTFVISPSREYHGGGAMKQDLTVHQTALIANYFASGHFSIAALSASPGWKHIYGPFLLYYPTGDNGQIMRAVEKQTEIEKTKWPYSFVNDPEYPLKRGTVSGYVKGQKKAAIVVYDSFTEKYDQQQLGYLFTNKTDSNGRFFIDKVRPGKYRVVVYPLAGQGSDLLEEAIINVTAGGQTQVNFTLTEPENIIWSLGEVDRRSSEFNLSDQPRNYQWMSYPPETNTFVIGQSDPKRDWYYAQSKPGHWFIKYNDTHDGRPRTLRVALAATSKGVHLIAKINGHQVGNWYHENDHAIYRSAMQSGLFNAHKEKVAAGLVKNGENTLELWLSLGQVMYDAISLQRS